MGNHEDGSRVVHEVALEPQQTHQVQVVGRFVQHEQVRLCHQQLRHVRAHHPATAHLAGRAVKILVLEGEPLQNLLGLGLNLVTIVRNEGIHGGGVLIAGVIAPGLALAQNADSLAHLRGGAHGNLQHRAVGGVAGFLLQVAHHGVVIHDNLPLIRRIIAPYHAEERGFSRPVGPYQRNALAPVDNELGLVEERAPGVCFGEFLDGQHGAESIHHFHQKANDFTIFRPTARNGGIFCLPHSASRVRMAGSTAA